MSHGKPLYYLIRQELARKQELAKDAAGKWRLSAQHFDEFKAELREEESQLAVLGTRLEFGDREIVIWKDAFRVEVKLGDDSQFIVSTADESTSHKNVASVNARLAKMLAF